MSRYCRSCALGGRCKGRVPGVGPVPTDVMAVGQAPGWFEDKHGVPFVHDAGQFLSNTLDSVGIVSRDVYYTNVCKCLGINSSVRLADGSTELIGHIVKHRLSVDVKTANGVGKVVGWHRNALGDRDMYSVSLLDARRTYRGLSRVQVTEDHEMLTERGWVRVDALLPSDRIASGETVPSNASLSVFEGSMLGDSSVSACNTYQLTHGEKQIEYYDWVINLIGIPMHTRDIAVSIKGKRHKVRKGFSPAMCFTRNQRKRWYPNGAKRVPRDIKLDAIALAVWFMDDGHLQVRINRSPMAQIAVHGFTLDDQEFLVERIQSLGVHCWLLAKRIRFGRVGTRSLLRVISSYMPPPMRYKTTYDSPPYVDLIPSSAPHYSGYTKHQIPYKGAVYCLTIDTEPNFVTTGGVVHNCFPGRKGRGDAAPPMWAVKACWPQLEEEIMNICPKLIIAVGTVAAAAFGISGGIHVNSGKLFETEWGLVMPVLHPAGLMRRMADVPKFNTQLRAARAYLGGEHREPPVFSRVEAL